MMSDINAEAMDIRGVAKLVGKEIGTANLTAVTPFC
jgi:hypothetical protein